MINIFFVIVVIVFFVLGYLKGTRDCYKYLRHELKSFGFCLICGQRKKMGH